MDIIKRLQLNKNPKDIKSGSIIGAKNIMLDPVSSTITNEYGFSSAYKAPGGFKIVGVIPCNEEICIFLNNGTVSKIQRLKDDGTVKDVNCNWTWEKGTITGTFAYNYNKELIVAVSEYGVEGKDIPLKIINLDTNDYNINLDNNLEENIPKFNCSYQITNLGSLVCGTYTFFIRFKISENTYTKWFQLTDDVIITNFVVKDSPNHFYSKVNGTLITANAGEFTDMYVNENLQSSSSIQLELNFEGNIFEKYQIGYIIKRDTEVLGRLYKEFDFTSNSVLVSENYFLEEINVNDFLEAPLQFFNCKNVINYNNRLYISNYNTYRKNNISNISDFIDVKVRLLEVNNEVILNKNNLIVSCGLFGRENPNVYTKTYENIETTQLNHSDSLIFVSRYILPQFKLHQSDIISIFAFKKHDTDLNNAICIYSESFDIPVDSSYYITFENGYIVINSSKGQYNIDGSDAFNTVNRGRWMKGYNDVTNAYPNNPLALTWLQAKYNVRSNIISDIDIKYNNNRTLIPGQVYNLFVHFIRKDGSYTEGYLLNNKNYSHAAESEVYTIRDNTVLTNFYFYNRNNKFYCPRFINETTNKKEFIIVPYFEINNRLYDNLPEDYVGLFISYEKIEITSIPLVSLDRTTPADKQYKFTSSNIIYDGNAQKGNIIKAGFSDKGYREPIINVSVDTSNYKQRELLIDLTHNIGNLYNDCRTIMQISRYDDIYNSKYKILYRLTENIYKNKDCDVNNAFMFLPGFYNREKVVYFDEALLFDAASTYVYKKEDNQILDESYYIRSICYRNFSHICLNALSIKQDYQKAAVVINNKTYLNNVLSPDKLKDFLELKQCYKSEPVISYTNYNDNFQDEFNKTIYRSDVISDESLVNGFRHFNIENYKNIFENKGNIVNIIGYGLYLLVHTEYSLFVFDRNNQLSENAQLQIPDTFDIDYKELTPSGEGFGGLRNKEESILTKHGYIWFDRINYSIFLFNGEIKPISADIHKLLKVIFTNYNANIVFAEDYISNRLLICIKYIENNIEKYITLSYSFDTETFISSHDYSFDKNYKTYNNSYLFNKNNNTEIYKFDKQSCNYLGLYDVHCGFDVIKSDDKVCSYVDIIFNDLYEVPKTLNSISYVMSRNNDFNFNTNIIDKYFNSDFDNEPHQNKLRLYSGFKLNIVTDLTFSGLLDISKNEEVNELNSIKPKWNNGIWNFNWFRENINKDVTNDELQQQKVNNQMKEVYQQHDNLYPSGLEKSDMRSNIIGKYFILRFIFERNPEDLNLKFETLDVNISKI